MSIYKFKKIIEMNAYIIFGLGIILGILIAFVLIYLIMPRLMLMEDESQYGMEESETMIQKKVKELGWSVPAKHDLKETLAKHDISIRHAKVFEICKPDYAARILKRSQERIVSAMMPCRIAIYEKEDGKTYISRMNSRLMAKPMKGVIPSVMKLAAIESEQILQSVIKK